MFHEIYHSKCQDFRRWWGWVGNLLGCFGDSKLRDFFSLESLLICRHVRQRTKNICSVDLFSRPSTGVFCLCSTCPSRHPCVRFASLSITRTLPYGISVCKCDMFPIFRFIYSAANKHLRWPKVRLSACVRVWSAWRHDRKLFFPNS